MKTHEAGANLAPRQPAASVGQQALGQTTPRVGANDPVGPQVDIDGSSRMLAQRRTLDAVGVNETGMPDQLKQESKPSPAWTCQRFVCIGIPTSPRT